MIARAAFKENKYLDVIKKCKKILKKDQCNYGALMLLAAAMKEIELDESNRLRDKDNKKGERIRCGGEKAASKW